MAMSRVAGLPHGGDGPYHGHVASNEAPVVGGSYATIRNLKTACAPGQRFPSGEEFDDHDSFLDP